MQKIELKVGDIIIGKYRWGNGYHEFIGYVYKASNLIVGASSKDGGVSNIGVKYLIEYQIVTKYETSDKIKNT